MTEQATLSTNEKHGQAVRATKGILGLFIVLACAIIIALVYAAITLSHDPGERVTIVSEATADHLDLFDNNAAWSNGHLERLQLLNSAQAKLSLKDDRPRFPRTGIWTSPQIHNAFPFTELIPSYNPHCPPETGLRFDVRAHDKSSNKWSPWFYLGSWGRTLAGQHETENDFGKVDVDTLILNHPADAYQVRVSFYAFNLDESINPTLRRVAVCYSGPSATAPPDLASTTPIAHDIPVPFRAQGNAAKPLRPEICSPTSVSMVMQYLGCDRPTEENALAIYDSEYGLFGNWARACAWAGENGFDAWITRYRNWEQVKTTLAQGQPIIASIRFKKGQCPSFVLAQTEGHLIVIRGFTKDGDFIVNDPASREKGNGAIYKADELAKAWFDHGGVGYIIKKPAE